MKPSELHSFSNLPCSVLGNNADSSDTRNYKTDITADVSQGDTRVMVRPPALTGQRCSTHTAKACGALLSLHAECVERVLCTAGSTLLPSTRSMRLALLC